MRGKKIRTQTVELDEEMHAPFDDGMDNRALHDPIGRLPRELRLPIVPYYIERFSVKEIAVLIHCPCGTVQNRLFRVREALRPRWLDAQTGQVVTTILHGYCAW